MAKRWLRLVWALMAALSLCACVPMSSLPTNALETSIQPTATPAPAQPMILVLPSSNQQAMISVNRHYSSVVKSKGWNIDFYTVQQYDDSGADSYQKYVAAQLASGVTKADGYFVYASSDGQQQEQALDKCKSDGLLLDCVAAAPAAIPDYWVRWKDDITAASYGLPLCSEPPAAIARFQWVFSASPQAQALAPHGIKGYHDIRALMDQLEAVEPARYAVVAPFRWWLEIWVREQGYFSPSSYPVPMVRDGVCVRLDDPDAKPVLLEDIPGFEEFLTDSEALRSSGRIIQDSQAARGRQVAGILDIGVYVVSPYIEHDPRLKDLYAYPLLTAQKYADDIYSSYTATERRPSNTELLIPARSRRAEEAMAFVQWVHASKENANCVIYGQQGEDFTLQGERIGLSEAFLQGLTSADARNTWPGIYAFSSARHPYVPLDAPQNTESLLTAWPPRELAAPWLVHLFDEEFLNNGSTDMAGMPGTERAILLSQLMSAMSEAANIKNVYIETFLDALHQTETEDVLGAYARLFETLRAME